MTEPPLALLAELTHRCPLRCAYCSNPLALSPASAELPTAAWKAALDEAGADELVGSGASARLAAPDDRAVVELDVDDALFGHAGRTP